MEIEIPTQRWDRKVYWIQNRLKTIDQVSTK